MEQDVAAEVRLDRSPAPPKRNRTLLKWSLAAAALVVGYFLWQFGSGMSAGLRFSDDAVRHFHSQLDSRLYDDILQESDQAFQSSDSPEEFSKFLAGVHSKLGRSIAFTRSSIFVTVGTGGTFVRTTYSSSFEQGLAGETFVWRKTSGGLKLFAYHIESKAFLTQ